MGTGSFKERTCCKCRDRSLDLSAGDRPEGLSLQMKKMNDFIIKNIPPYRVWVSRAWEKADIAPFVQNIKSYTESNEREILLDSRNRVVCGGMEDAQGSKIKVVIKQFRKRSHYDTVRFAVIRSKALRSFLNALELKKIGIGTPEPVFCAEKRDGAFLLESYYVCHYVPHDFSLHRMFMGKRDVPMETTLSELAATVRKIHESGFIFGDLNGANVLIQFNNNQPKFYFIDLNRMRKLKSRKRESFRRAFDLSWLGIPPEYRVFFLDAYTGAPGTEIHEHYSFILKYRRNMDAVKKVRRLWRKK